jgi:phage repressor protein C with HTH and peptisase S24 domain
MSGCRLAELISSLDSEIEATNMTAPVTAAANNTARNNKALPKNTLAKKRSSSWFGSAKGSPALRRQPDNTRGRRTRL